MVPPAKPVTTLDEKAVDLVSAAIRHLRDAEFLADREGAHPSPDQAYHLAGYAPECMRKATLGVRWFDKAIGHRFDEAAGTAIDFAIAMDPMALRYNPRGIGDHFTELKAWREDVRYLRSGRIAPAQVERCVAESRELVEELLFALWWDGRLGREVLSW